MKLNFNLLIKLNSSFVSDYQNAEFGSQDDCDNDDIEETMDDEDCEQEQEEMDREQEGMDSEATISDDEQIVCSSDSEDSDSELVVEEWSNQSGTQKKLVLSDFERDFVYMYLSGKFSEAQGDMIIKLFRKHNLNIKTRKPKALVNHLAEVSFDHYHYVECDCGKILKKENNKFYCVKCEKYANAKILANYVAFNVEQQIKVTSKQLPDVFGNNFREELTLRLFIACDEIPLSISSKVELLPVLLYIENISQTYLRNQCSN